MSTDKRHEVLNQSVADLSQFAVVIHQAHWYMRGTGFLRMHPKMDDYMDEINDFLDEIAERLITIGGSPFSTLKEFADNTKISDEKGSYDKSMADHVEMLIKNYRYLQSLAEEGIEVSSEAGDSVTEDIFIGMKGAVEKNLWMLTAELGRAPEL